MAIATSFFFCLSWTKIGRWMNNLMPRWPVKDGGNNSTSFSSEWRCRVLLHMVTSIATDLLATAFAMHMDNMHLYERTVTPGWTWQWRILLCMWNLAVRGKTRGSNFLRMPAWLHRQSLFRLLRDVYACVMLCYVAGIFEGTERQIGLLGLAVSVEDKGLLLR